MYELKYDLTGNVSVIIRKSDGKPIFISENNSDFIEFLEWNNAQAIPLNYTSVNTTIANAWQAKQEARRQAIIDNLPSWAVVGGKFDAMTTAANAATNLAQAKAVLIELITTMKKVSRCVYWDIKNTEE